jgi:8-oxo-dGTP diphosphatase
MPSLGVNIAVVHSGQILLTMREDFEVWCLPGGQVDDDESLAAAAIREAREETGLDVKLTRLVGMYSHLGLEAGGIHIALFAAEPVGGKLRHQQDEVLEIGYFDPKELPRPLLSWHRQRILDVLDDVKGSATWRQEFVWPVGKGVSRKELYQLRDQSGLSRQEFYLQYMAQDQSELDTLEVPIA